MTSESKCPFAGGARAHTNRDWWPDQLNLQVLHQHSTLSDPKPSLLGSERTAMLELMGKSLDQPGGSGTGRAVGAIDRPQ